MHGGSGGMVGLIGAGSTLAAGAGSSTFGATGTSTFGGTGGSIFAGSTVMICGGNFGQSHVTGNGSGSLKAPFKLFMRKMIKIKQTDSTIAERIDRGDIRRIFFGIVI